MFRSSKKTISSVFVILVFVIVAYTLAASGYFAEPLYGAVVVVQAHNDDFDLSVSGIALSYQQKGSKIIVVTLTDCGADQVTYTQLTSSGIITADGLYDTTLVAPDGETWVHPFHSLSLSHFRISRMAVRYQEFGFTLIQPDNLLPDGVGNFAPSSALDSYRATCYTKD